MSRKVFLDFEFNDTNEKHLNVVCVSYLSQIDGVTKIETIWLLDPTERARFINILESWDADGVTLVAFFVIAEARSILSLGIDPRRFHWIDLWIEYRMLLNHNHAFECGKQLIKGQVKHIKPPLPKWEQGEGYTTGGKAEVSLAACTYKMLNRKRDTTHKRDMVSLILSKYNFDEIEALDIMDYCEEDIRHLPEIHEKIFSEMYRRYEPTDRLNIAAEIHQRGAYAVATAIMQSKGYAIDYVSARAFSDSVKDITFQMQTEVNEEFPEVRAFLSSVKKDKYTQKKKNIQAWVKAQNIKDWEKTDKGDISLKLDAFESHFSHKEDQKIFGNRFVKYLRDKQSLNGFTSNSTKKNLWDFVGRDKRVRPHFGIYVAQSSRSQPSATGYVLLKSSWMRYLLQAPVNKCMVSIDYGQQEFLLAGLLSEDKNMLDAYHSGDPYLYTAKIAKAVPPTATKKSHSFMRDKFKSTCLAIQFGMTEFGLAKKLTRDMGVVHSEEEALELINLFEDSYPDYVAWKQDIFEEYIDKGYLKLRDGWTMFSDNYNKRSVTNMPVQGHGAAIMRKAVILAQNVGLDVTMTLHDALYVECESTKAKLSLEKLAWCMTEAFRYYFTDTPLEQYATCRLDPAIWGYSFSGETVHTSMGEVVATRRYIDSRRFEDYKRYRKYFVPKEDLELLTSM